MATTEAPATTAAPSDALMTQGGVGSVSLGRPDSKKRSSRLAADCEDAGNPNTGQPQQQATDNGGGGSGAPGTAVGAPRLGSWTGLSGAVATQDPVPQPG